MINTTDMNWGNIHLNGYNSSENEALFIFNFDLTTMANVRNVILFVTSKILWNNSHLPENSKQQFIFDVRGQDVFDNVIKEISESIEAKISLLSPIAINYSINFKFS